MIIDKTFGKEVNGMKSIIEAINKGWTVSTVANVLAHGKNDEGRGYIVRLNETKSHISREMFLPYSPEAESLLNNAPIG